MWGKKYIMLFSLFALNLVDQPAPKVTIRQGTLSGKISPDGTFFEYLGIPYGTVNKTNRFKEPLPPPSWEGVYKAVEEIHTCPQFVSLTTMGMEDCLKVNVFVPATIKNEALPVMVYIHGGAYLYGSGGKFIYAPDFLVKHNVIIVTMNYRLGALGFLCLHHREAPGNAGLRDQVAALRWVKRNIAAFGGDPDNITVFGESAGAAATSILLASKATKGLFKKAIMQSGSSLASWTINRKPLWTSGLWATSLGYDTHNDDPNKLYDFFSKMSMYDLVTSKTMNLKPPEKFDETKLIHLPCIEKSFPDLEPILDDLPYNLLNNFPKDVTVITGSNSNEGMFLLKAESNESLSQRNGRYLFSSDLEFTSDEEAFQVNKNIQDFYFGDGPISILKLLNASVIFTHLHFETQAILESELFLQRSNKSKVYNYYFNYSGGRNLPKLRSGFSNVTGACHADEIMYLFKTNFWPFRINQEDQLMIDWMTTMWTNFAKYGDPTPTNSNLPVRWEPSTTDNMKCLYIDNKLTMGPLPNSEAHTMWKNIYGKFRRRNYDFQA